MGLLSLALYGVAGAVTLQLLASYIAGGWVAKYTSPAYSFADIPDLTGKVAIVTGTNTGIGYVTARELARKGATVIATARSRAKGEAALSKMQSDVGAATSMDLRFMELDLASFESVRSFSRTFLDTGKIKSMFLIVVVRLLCCFRSKAWRLISWCSMPGL
jgi:hypothetical protein